MESPAPTSSAQPSMDESVEGVEKILNYSFTNKELLKVALTHDSRKTGSFDRLEFLGDSVLGTALANYFHITYPELNLHELRALRSANVSNERFARVAVKHGLFQFLVRHNGPSKIIEKVRLFSEAVSKEDGLTLRGLVKAPKILADLVESIAGAVYIDVNFDMQRVWEIWRGLLEPMFKLDDLRRQHQPLVTLSPFDKERLDMRCWDEDRKSLVGQVNLDSKFIASGNGKDGGLTKLANAKEALQSLSECMPIEKVIDEDSLDVENEDVKGKLIEICSTKKLQISSSSFPTTSDNPLPYETTPNTTVIDEDGPHVEPEDAKGKLFEISYPKKLQILTGSSSLPTASENPLTDETTPTKMVIDEDSLLVEPEDARRKLFESTIKLQIQTGSSSSPPASENPLTGETTPTKMVIDEDSLQVEPEDARRKLFESTIKLQTQTGSSSFPTASENDLTYEMTPKQMVVDKDSLQVKPEDAKGKLFEICSTKKRQRQTRSSSFPTASENPLPYETTPNKRVIDEDSLHADPEDAIGELFEICSTKKRQRQTGSYPLPTASENPLPYETTPIKTVIDEDSLHVEPEDAKGELFEICSTRKLQIQTGSSSLPTASENPLTYEMTQKQMVVDKDNLEVNPKDAKSKLFQFCAKKKWPKPIYSVEEKCGLKRKKRFVCSVKIEIPTVEGTFHMKGDEKSRKKQAENSSAYHMIRALKSSLMSLVIKNLQMQESLEEKKNLQMQECSEENKRKRKRIKII